MIIFDPEAAIKEMRAMVRAVEDEILGQDRLCAIAYTFADLFGSLDEIMKIGAYSAYEWQEIE